MASARSRWCRVGALLLLSVLAGCSGQSQRTSYRGLRTSPGHWYPHPGPPGDPWGPYINQASSRFGVPPLWVRSVMRQESGGQEQVISSAGAMGLMQVMPDTYAGLRDRYGLGDDPFEPHDNILAGTAYIREMYDRYGAPGFLAAYNAGPNRLDRYLYGGTPLPDETVSYVAAIAPRIGGAGPMTGPLSVYAGTGGGVQYASFQSGPAAAAVVLPTATGPCDADAAYDPDRPCAPVITAGATVPPPPEPRSVLYQPSPLPAVGPVQPITALPASVPAAVATAAPPVAGGWAIQVGAFLSPELARVAADNARSVLPGLLGAAPAAFPPTEPFGTTRLYRARLTNLSARAAGDACTRLSQLQQACMVVQPGHS